MSIHSSRFRAEAFDRGYSERNNEAHVELRQIAADHLQQFARHMAGGGSEYVYLGDIKVRFADHDNISSKHSSPDFNCVKRGLTSEELAEIRAKVGYPDLAKKTALAMHVGLTWPKVKKLLTPDCFESVVLDDYYPNTKYEFVRVAPALALLVEAGHTKRIPVAQENWSNEDYHPDYY